MKDDWVEPDDGEMITIKIDAQTWHEIQTEFLQARDTFQLIESGVIEKVITSRGTLSILKNEN